jgi:hypothetical protein
LIAWINGLVLAIAAILDNFVQEFGALVILWESGDWGDWGHGLQDFGFKDRRFGRVGISGDRQSVIHQQGNQLLLIDMVKLLGLGKDCLQ